MKKKIFSILLIVILMMSMLVGLTACGDEEKDDDKSDSLSSDEKRSVDISSENSEEFQYSEVTSPEEAIEKLAEAINNKDAETVLEMIDLVGTYAAGSFADEYISQIQAVKPGETVSNSNYSEKNPIKSFEEAYEYCEDIVEPEDLEDLTVLVRYMISNAGNLKLNISDISKGKKVRGSDSLYQYDVTFDIEGLVNEEKEKLEDYTETIFVFQKDGEYFVALDDLFYDELEAKIYPYGVDSLYGLCEQEIEGLNMDYYAYDDYTEATPAQTLTEADFCKGINDSWQIAVKDMKTNETYTSKDKYNGDDSKLLIEGDKIWIYEIEGNQYYYITFKKGKNGNVLIDEFKHFKNGNWEDWSY